MASYPDCLYPAAAKRVQPVGCARQSMPPALLTFCCAGVLRQQKMEQSNELTAGMANRFLTNICFAKYAHGMTMQDLANWHQVFQLFVEAKAQNSENIKMLCFHKVPWNTLFFI